MGGHPTLDEPGTVHGCGRLAALATDRTAVFHIEQQSSWIWFFEEMHGVKVVAVAGECQCCIGKVRTNGEK